MIRNVIILAFLLAFSGARAFAAEAPRAEPAAPAAEPTAPAEAVSAVSESESLRDPFWPVGWKPAPVVAEPDRPQVVRPVRVIAWDEAAKKLKLSGISKSAGVYLAVLQGIGVVEKGDVISIEHGELTYRWIVRSITSKGIVPERLAVDQKK